MNEIFPTKTPNSKNSAKKPFRLFPAVSAVSIGVTGFLFVIGLLRQDLVYVTVAAATLALTFLIAELRYRYHLKHLLNDQLEQLEEMESDLIRREDHVRALIVQNEKNNEKNERNAQQAHEELDKKRSELLQIKEEIESMCNEIRGEMHDAYERSRAVLKQNKAIVEEYEKVYRKEVDRQYEQLIQFYEDRLRSFERH